MFRSLSLVFLKNPRQARYKCSVICPAAHEASHRPGFSLSCLLTELKPYKKKNMLFAGWEVNIVENCHLFFTNGPTLNIHCDHGQT